MSTLENCYKALQHHVLWDPEPFEVVQLVEAYRNFWKPRKVKVLLLAESHVYTSHEEYSSKVCIDGLSRLGCPENFVRYVYCLGYGESQLLDKRIKDNPGTWQYWRIFQSCCNDSESPKPIKYLTVMDKIKLLQQLKDEGVWLLDSCPIGLYGQDSNGVEIKKMIKPNHYREFIDISWEKYIKDQITICNPEVIVVIGKMVWNILEDRLPKGRSTWVYQPNARQGSSYLSEHSPKTLGEKIRSLQSSLYRHPELVSGFPL